MNIDQACESFKKLLQEQQERIEKMNSQKVDFSAREQITIGIIDGDGIGPIIMAQAVRVLKTLLAEERSEERR
jgi:isocitrate dehydrogenase (NAD+)